MIKLEKGDNMFTPHNVDLNANTTSDYVQEQRVVISKKSPDNLIYKAVNKAEVPNWTPDDLLKALETVGFPFNTKRGYYNVHPRDRQALIEILSEKIFAWEKEEKITYEQIDKIIHVACERPMGRHGGLFVNFVAGNDSQPIIDFLGKLVLLGEKDERYYDLIEMMLTVQAMGERHFPLGCTLYNESKDDFINKILNKLPDAWKERLSKATFYYYDEDVDRTYCYTVLGRKLVYAD